MKLSKVTYRVKDKNAKYKKEYNVRAAVANNSETQGEFFIMFLELI